MRARILVLARETTSRAALAQALARAGHDVELAESAYRARELAGDRIDLAIATVSSPRAGEIAIARELRDAIGRVVLIAGRAEDAARLRAGFPEADAILSEPIKPTTIVSRVGQVLEAVHALPTASAPMMLSFDGCTLDLGGRSFVDAKGREVSLSHAQFSLLTIFARHAGLVLSRDYLRNALPGNPDAFDRSIDMLVMRLRQKIEPDPKAPRFILTVPGAGYKWNARPRAFEATRGSRDLPAAASHVAALLRIVPGRRRLCLVVLPFGNLGGKAQDDLFIDSITQSLTTDLARIPGAAVIERKTAFAHGRSALDAQRLGREFGIRYVVEGSVLPDRDRLRVNVQLIDAETGAYLWAERFDRVRRRPLDTQDEIVTRIARGLDAELTAAEARRAERAVAPSSDDLTYRARAIFNRNRSAHNLREAARLFREALALEAENVEALTGLALVTSSYPHYFSADECVCDFPAAETAAAQALELAPEHARAHCALGWIYTYSGRPGLGVAAAERAIALDRNQPHAHAAIGLAKIFLGRANEAEDHIAEALRLSPHDIFAYQWHDFVGTAKLYLGEWQDAIRAFSRVPETRRLHPLRNFFLASALAWQGERAEAQAATEAGLALVPGFTLNRFRAAPLGDNPAYLMQRERLTEGMQKAGLPEA